MAAVTTSAPVFCTQMESEIGGETYTGCVSANASTGFVDRSYGIGTGTNLCYVEATMSGTPPACSGAANMAYDACDTPTPTLQTCITAAANSAECGGTGFHCAAGRGGTCNSTSALCD